MKNYHHILKTDRLKAAYDFAEDAHGRHAKGWPDGFQKRKYNGAPYIVHPLEVAELIVPYAVDEDDIIAALLHDVVEDTTKNLHEINEQFGPQVTLLVYELTDISSLLWPDSKDPSRPNRKTRKELDRRHLAGASARGQNIKFVDSMVNTRDIAVNDPDFFKVFAKEKDLLLPSLTKGDRRLYNQAIEALRAAKEINNGR